MEGFPDFSQILSVKIEAGRTDKGKALAEQQGLILQVCVCVCARVRVRVGVRVRVRVRVRARVYLR